MTYALRFIAAWRLFRQSDLEAPARAKRNWDVYAAEVNQRLGIK